MNVDFCIDCPFLHNAPGEYFKCVADPEKREFRLWERRPDWCPLMKGPIVVQHREGEPVCRIARCHHCLPADTHWPSMDMCTLKSAGEERVDEPEMYTKPAPDWCPRRSSAEAGTSEDPGGGSRG